MEIVFLPALELVLEVFTGVDGGVVDDDQGGVLLSNPRLRLKARKQGVGVREFLRFATL